MANSVRSFLTRKLNYLFGFLLLASFGTLSAQSYTATGFDYLGTCSGHQYYISTAYYTGSNIAAAVADFRTKTGVSENMAYATAIGTSTENACITSLMQAYNMTTYGNALAPGQDWGNPRNAWIGFTDAGSEGKFYWSNGQPFCPDKFINWNYKEPNDFSSNVGFSNGEDYTEILIMSSYNYLDPFTGQQTNMLIDPLGKWNDWFNTVIIDKDGTTKGITMLPVIIEVGAKECTLIPPPPPTRGNLGCTLGYWKNAKDYSWTQTKYSRTDKYSLIFGIYNGRKVITLNETSLQQALETGAGGYNNLVRQSVAALLNAGRGFYPFTTTEIIAAVQSMFNMGTATLPTITVNGKTYGGSFSDAGALADYLDKLNNAGCPLNNAGIFSTSSTSRQDVTSASSLLAVDNQFTISGYPNPSSGGFNVQIDGTATDKVSIRVTDMLGRLIEQRSNVAANQTLQIGDQYKAGMYYIEVEQSGVKKQLKLVKQ